MHSFTSTNMLVRMVETRKLPECHTNLCQCGIALLQLSITGAGHVSSCPSLVNRSSTLKIQRIPQIIIPICH